MKSENAGLQQHAAESSSSPRSLAQLYQFNKWWESVIQVFNDTATTTCGKRKFLLSVYFIILSQLKRNVSKRLFLKPPPPPALVMLIETFRSGIKKEISTFSSRRSAAEEWWLWDRSKDLWDNLRETCEFSKEITQLSLSLSACLLFIFWTWQELRRRTMAIKGLYYGDNQGRRLWRG